MPVDVAGRVSVWVKRIANPSEVPCSSCRDICKRLLRHDSGSYNHTTFKKLKRADCPLCKVFSRALEDDGAKVGYSYVGHEAIWPTYKPSASELPGDRGQIHISTLYPTSHDVVLRVRRGRPPDPASSAMATHSARASFSAIKDWLQFVEENKLRVTLSYPATFGMHLVDLHQGCIRRFEVSDNFSLTLRYAALSYVWGGCRQLQLTKARYSELLSPRSLTRLREEIPRTIRDAMLVALELGFGYLWVDVLCITQDSEEEKTEQIGRMNVIYSHAALTIVNAAGEDANSPLPGLSHGERCQYSHPCLAQLDPRICDPDKADKYKEKHQLWITPAHPGDVTTDEAICDSKWYSRGWTFQELVLSSRLLIFTKHYVICHSSRQMLAEDELSGGALMRCRWDPLARFSGVGSLHMYWEFSSQMEPGSTTKPSLTHMLRIYGELVSRYTARDLTRDEDALLAFEGILSSLRYSFGEFFFGLPRKSFVHFLYWSIPSDSKARVRRRSRCFPSWTWASWRTPLHIPEFEPGVGEVCCHMVEDTPPLRLTVVDDTCQCSDRGQEMYSQVAQALARLGGGTNRDRPSGMIAFWTEEISLTIKEMEVSAFAAAERQGDETRAEYVAKTRERYRPGVDLFDDHGISSGSQVKFVRITQHVASQGPLTVRAMMIRDDGPISYRIGCTGYNKNFWGYGLLEEVWIKAKPTPRLVILA